MKYTVVRASELELFLIRVNEKIAQGWILQGGVSIAQNVMHEIIYAQAFIEK